MSAIAPGIEFDFDGQTYVLPRVLQGDKKIFHRWANARALMELDDLAAAVKSGDLSPERYAQQQKATNDKVTAGQLHPDDEGGRERLFTTAGLTQMAFICMNRHDAKVTRETVERIIAINGIYWLPAKYFEANADPNATTPPTTAKAGENDSSEANSTPT